MLEEDLRFKDYQWVYMVFAREYTFLFEMYPFYDLPEFFWFELPKGELPPVQVRIILLDSNQTYVDSSYDVVPAIPSNIKAVLNVAPFKMRTKFLLTHSS